MVLHSLSTGHYFDIGYKYLLSDPWLVNILEGTEVFSSDQPCEHGVLTRSANCLCFHWQRSWDDVDRCCSHGWSRQKLQIMEAKTVCDTLAEVPRHQVLPHRETWRSKSQPTATRRQGTWRHVTRLHARDADRRDECRYDCPNESSRWSTQQNSGIIPDDKRRTKTPGVATPLSNERCPDEEPQDSKKSGTSTIWRRRELFQASLRLELASQLELHDIATSFAEPSKDERSNAKTRQATSCKVRPHKHNPQDKAGRATTQAKQCQTSQANAISQITLCETTPCQHNADHAMHNTTYPCDADASEGNLADIEGHNAVLHVLGPDADIHHGC